MAAGVVSFILEFIERESYASKALYPILIYFFV
jgi:hypothetical protein